ncbi:MAG: 50S ribosomal protein L13 [Patescibacteria group bacterium]
MKITQPGKMKELVRKWRIVDAQGKVLGQIAVAIADALRGKDKVIFTPHLDLGDFIIVINAKDVVLTGNKMEQKEYYRHSRYFGNLKVKTAKEKIENNKPEEIIMDAVKGMIPRNKLRKDMISRLKIYSGATHPHEAQQPTPMNV